ncbi:Uncharacterised protein [Salmonella enterica subsp. arizonae]|uniref:Uncharacterized protein n=1 Tax=Salmonella enterica subsp. arizonae TaxID=59203 RepID=A0A2X4TIY3_SALER|nr:Uncharacterised protein [Salmonella enterica subsp. arizonae]
MPLAYWRMWVVVVVTAVEALDFGTLVTVLLRRRF